MRVKYSATLTSPDQWTLEEPLPSQLPLLRFEVNDEDDSRIYVSQAGAEVVMYSTHRQRTMAWLGAIPHWIYPTMLRRHVHAWSLGIIALSALGTVMTLAGIAIGIWHWRWRVRRTRWSGGADTAAAPRPSALDAWRTMSAGGHTIAEIRPERIAGHPYYNGTTPDGHGILVAADTTVAAITEPLESALIDNARRVLAGAPLVDVSLLVRGDDYYRETEGRVITGGFLTAVRCGTCWWSGCRSAD